MHGIGRSAATGGGAYLGQGSAFPSTREGTNESLPMTDVFRAWRLPNIRSHPLSRALETRGVGHSPCDMLYRESGMAHGAMLVVARKEKKVFANRFPTRDSAAVAALAANVRRLRLHKEWSQARLASETSIEQNAISLIENGRSNPTVRIVEEIARALGVRIGELLELPPPSHGKKR